MKSKHTQTIEAIASEILTLAHAIMDDSRMGLRESALNKDVDVVVRSFESPVVIETVFNQYIDYIENGRRPMTGKQPPIDALRHWALAKGIPTDNSTLFLIARAIWRNGYEGRPVLATLEHEIEERWQNQWADMLVDDILQGIEL